MSMGSAIREFLRQPGVEWAPDSWRGKYRECAFGCGGDEGRGHDDACGYVAATREAASADTAAVQPDQDRARRGAESLADLYRTIIDERARATNAIQFAIVEAGHMGTQDEVARLFGVAQAIWRERRDFERLPIGATIPENHALVPYSDLRELLGVKLASDFAERYLPKPRKPSLEEEIRDAVFSTDEVNAVDAVMDVLRRRGLVKE